MKHAVTVGERRIPSEAEVKVQVKVVENLEEYQDGNLWVFATSRSGTRPSINPARGSTKPPVIPRIVPSLMMILIVSSRRWHAVVSLRRRSGRVAIPWSLMVVSRTPVGVHTRVSIVSGRGSRRRRHRSGRHPRRKWWRVVVTAPNRAIRIRLPRSRGRVIVARSTRSRSKVFSLPLIRWSRVIPGDRHRTRTPGSDS